MSTEDKYEIPPRPSHLTKAERVAVFEKAVRDYVKSLDISNESAPLTHGDFAKHHAAYHVVVRWHKERIEALEADVASLKAAKPRVRVPARSDK